MEGGWNVRNLYFYLVCLVTLFMMVGGFIAAANSLVEMVLPERPNVPLIYVYYPEYREALDEPVFEFPPEEELLRRREEQESMDHYYTSWARRRLLNSVAFIIIPAPFYIYHWKAIRSRKREDGS